MKNKAQALTICCSVITIIAMLGSVVMIGDASADIATLTARRVETQAITVPVKGELRQFVVFKPLDRQRVVCVSDTAGTFSLSCTDY
jgi:hypothetical protein